MDNYETSKNDLSVLTKRGFQLKNICKLSHINKAFLYATYTMVATERGLEANAGEEEGEEGTGTNGGVGADGEAKTKADAKMEEEEEEEEEANDGDEWVRHYRKKLSGGEYAEYTSYLKLFRMIETNRRELEVRQQEAVHARELASVEHERHLERLVQDLRDQRRHDAVLLKEREQEIGRLRQRLGALDTERRAQRVQLEEAGAQRDTLAEELRREQDKGRLEAERSRAVKRACEEQAHAESRTKVAKMVDSRRAVIRRVAVLKKLCAQILLLLLTGATGDQHAVEDDGARSRTVGRVMAISSRYDVLLFKYSLSATVAAVGDGGEIDQDTAELANILRQVEEEKTAPRETASLAARPKVHETILQYESHLTSQLRAGVDAVALNAECEQWLQLLIERLEKAQCLSEEAFSAAQLALALGGGGDNRR